MDPENTGRKRRGAFQPGRSGNPAGRPKGARNRATIAAEMLLEGEAQTLTRKAIELAKAGDTTALRLCLERLLPPRKDRAISFELPPIVSVDDAPRAIGALLAAVADGRITPSEAVVVTSLIDAQCRAMGADVAPVRAANVQVSFVPSEPRTIVQ
jgi:hypothetical protein